MSRSWFTSLLARGRWPLAVAVVLRLLLWSLPGLGRDEATYVYWSQHFETWYAPLLQFLLAVEFGAFGPHPLLLRLLPLALGLVNLWLLELWLRERGFPQRERGVALAAVAASPWQVYVGAFVHPDGLLLAAMLLFALAAARRQLLLAAGAATLALLAKPSGALVLAFAMGWCLKSYHEDRRRVVAAISLMLLAAVALASRWNLPMLEALRSFGHQSTTLAPLARVALGIGGVAFLAGPLPVLAGLKGTSWPLNGPAGVQLGRAYFGAFLVAAILLGQVKANWLLPGIVLSWPMLDLGKGRIRVALMASLLLSSSMVIAFRSPDTLRRVEEALGERAPRYLDFAGRRESEVASAHFWWQRCAEYQSLDEWVEKLTSAHPEVRQARALISDDYGLAARTAVALQKIGPNPLPRLVLPLDPLFDRRRDDPIDRAMAWPVVLAVRHDCDELMAGPAVSVEWTHPITGERIQLAWPEPVHEGERP